MAEPQETPGVVNQRPGGALLSGFIRTYATANKTLGAYTPDVESSAFSGDAGGVAAVSAAANVAKLTDLNALRVAYENLRAFVEDLAQVVNSIIDDLE